MMPPQNLPNELVRRILAQYGVNRDSSPFEKSSKSSGSRLAKDELDTLSQCALVSRTFRWLSREALLAKETVILGSYPLNAIKRNLSSLEACKTYKISANLRLAFYGDRMLEGVPELEYIFDALTRIDPFVRSVDISFTMVPLAKRMETIQRLRKLPHFDIRYFHVSYEAMNDISDMEYWVEMLSSEHFPNLETLVFACVPQAGSRVTTAPKSFPGAPPGSLTSLRLGGVASLWHSVIEWSDTTEVSLESLELDSEELGFSDIVQETLNRHMCSHLERLSMKWHDATAKYMLGHLHNLRQISMAIRLDGSNAAVGVCQTLDTLPRLQALDIHFYILTLEGLETQNAGSVSWAHTFDDCLDMDAECPGS